MQHTSHSPNPHWKTLVSFQTLPESVGQIYCMSTNKGGGEPQVEYNMGTGEIIRQFNFQIDKIVVKCDMTEHQVIDEINKVFESFTDRIKINPADPRHIFEVNRAKSRVAMRSRRGIANTTWGRATYYKGTSNYDCPVTVAECNGKYGIYIMPEYDNYGFITEYE